MAVRPGVPGQDVPGRTWAGWVAYHAWRWLPLVAVAVLTYLVFPLPTHLAAPVLQVGEVSERTVTAPFFFVVHKSDAERGFEGEAKALAARPVYRFAAAGYDSVMIQVDTFFAQLDGAARAGVDQVRDLAGAAGARIGRAEAEYLLDAAKRRVVKAALDTLLRASLLQGVADASAIRAESSRLVALRRGEAERLVSRDSILTFPDLMARAEEPRAGVADEIGRRVVRQLTAAFYRPTIVPDPVLTNLRREALRASIDTVKYSVPAGERIVVARQRVTPEARDKLVGLGDELRRRGQDTLRPRAIVGGFLYNAIILSTFWLMLLLYRRESYEQLHEMVFLGALFAVVVLLSAGLERLFPWRTELTPIPFAAILLTMLYNGRTAVFAALTLAILIGGQWALRESNVVFFGMVGGVAAALGMRVVRRRRHLYVTVGVVAGAYTLAALAMGLLGAWTTGAIVSTAVTGSIVALTSASFALLVMPVAEQATRITTDLTLLELSDLGRPLLQRLAFEAPGTWAHSLAMANLCEAACNVIGANGLLARVGCYYHDIGKLKSPQFFVENQAPGTNPHDGLTPEESARIIRDHVAYGLELAHAAGLPKVVCAFIPEHHGTAEINYFLHRARRRSPSGDIDIRDFRYPGPRPQSVETAVAMLADSAEAAVRVLDDPTADMVAVAIDKLMEQKLHSKQLEEAPITLRDLDRIKEEFRRTMAGMYHNRVGYPRASGGIESEFQPAERT